VYAVFEVKQTLCAKWIADAGEKAASVRRLKRTSRPMLSGGVQVAAREQFPIVAGILSLDAVWAGPFARRVETQMQRLGGEKRLDLGCCLRCGSFEWKTDGMDVCGPERSLIWFMFRLLARLGQMGTAPAVDFSAYAGAL
jgi:hypothetical protein